MDLTEKTLGEFRLLRKLGAGGMAEVYLAEQTTLQRYVAVKVMRPEMVHGSDEIMLERFKQEAMSAAGLNHPNIIQVYTVGESEGLHFIAQEYVQGKNLSEYLRKGVPDMAACLHIMQRTAAALKAASTAGIIHRDIKPENIMLSKKGEVKVADFGLAQLMHREEDVSKTADGKTMGTPLYMSPEQVTGAELDQRSDLYSFGITCYHMFAGMPPFTGRTALEIASKQLKQAPEPLESVAPKTPRVLCRIVHKLIEKKPDDRYVDADAVLKDIRTLARAFRDKQDLDKVVLPVLGDLGLTGAEPGFKPLADSGVEISLKDSDPKTPSAPSAPAAPSSPKKNTAAAPPPAAKPKLKPTKVDSPSIVETPDSLEDFDDGALDIEADTGAPTSGKSKKPPLKSKADRIKSRANKPRKREDDEEEFGLRKADTEFEEMDLTPMVDVTFLLLIFFMITASFSLQKTIEVPPPDPDEEGATAQTQIDEIMEESVRVEIDEENIILVDDEPCEAEDLIDILGDKLAIEDKNELVLEASEKSLHDTVVKVFDAAHEVGMQHIRQVVRTE